jgi:hypothetical protein
MGGTITFSDGETGCFVHEKSVVSQYSDLHGSRRSQRGNSAGRAGKKQEAAGLTGGFRDLSSGFDPAGGAVQPDDWVAGTRSLDDVLVSGVAAVADGAAYQTGEDD